MRSETTPILPSSSSSSSSQSAYLLYSHRFYVLFIFSFLSFNQCLIWLTFSPIARSTEIYYKISESTIDLFLNWGCIIFIPCLPLAYILLNKHHGLRKCVILLAMIDFLAALVRVIPMVITTPSSPNFSSISLPFLHLGQILNAACGPLVMVPVSQLSCLWFAPYERTRATTIAIVANNFGSTIGFIVGPLIVSVPEYLPRLLYLHLGLASLACILALIYFPAQPPSPPSAAAELLNIDSRNEQAVNSWKLFLKNTCQCLTTPAFLLISTAGGLVPGILGIWTSLFDVILRPEDISEEQAGWLAFSSSIAGIFGGIVLSILADKPRFQHSLKTLILISYLACLISIIWFELSIHTYFYDRPILPSTIFTLGLSTTLTGLFYNGASPLIYEALAEIMYPLPESLSASILVQWMNIVSLVVLFIAPNRYKLVNFLVLITILSSLLMILFARFTYRRRDEDERKRREKEEEQVQSHDDSYSAIES